MVSAEPKGMVSAEPKVDENVNIGVLDDFFQKTHPTSGDNGFNWTEYSYPDYSLESVLLNELTRKPVNTLQGLLNVIYGPG